MLTSILCVVHWLLPAIRLEEYFVPDAFWACAERRCNEVPRDPNAILNAIDTTQTRIGLVLCLTVLMNDLQPNQILGHPLIAKIIVRRSELSACFAEPRQAL